MRIARTLGIAENKPEIVPPEKPQDLIEQPVVPTRYIVFSDTNNDVKAVKNTLRFAGIFSEQDELTDNIEGIAILHTGDLLNKKRPDPSVVEFWQLLQQNADTHRCQVKLVAGNHEQDIWRSISAGEEYGLGREQANRLKDYIESLDLFYVAGPVLFIHGYPTLEFLQTLLHFKEVTGRDLNCFNEDHYKKAFKSVNAMRQYAYERENQEIHYLLYDVADASDYYETQGQLVGAVLAKLKIEMVVHGHRPQRSGVQVDYEFGKWIPNVRMIGNDTQVRRKGIGATVIRETSRGELDIVFINTKTQSYELRSKIQEYLREAPMSSSASCANDPDPVAIKTAAQG